MDALHQVNLNNECVVRATMQPAKQYLIAARCCCNAAHYMSGVALSDCLVAFLAGAFGV